MISIYKSLVSFKYLLVFLVLFCLNRADHVDSNKHSDKPMMLLVSFDGFRWDYLNMYDLSNFNYLKQVGSYADYIYNSFATVTFANHWTIVTGLYEESHGIVQNQMHDRELKLDFSHYAQPDNNSVKWYGQNKITEPIWITNQKADSKRRSAAEWMGSSVSFSNQSIISIPYHSMSDKDLIDHFIRLYTDKHNPINFGAIYIDEPDSTGHIFGPYSNEMKDKLHYINDILGYLINELKAHHLFEKLNLIVTSDHGMESISKDTAIYLDSYVDTSLFDIYGSRAVFNLFVKEASNLQKVYEGLSKAKNMDVYKKEDIPEELHYKNNVRIGDLVLVAKNGYAIFLKNETINWSRLNGAHGYYNNQSSMYPIFIAHGPRFKKNFKIKSFHNVDIYPLMCLLLGLEPGKNNGSIDNVMAMIDFSEINENNKNIYIILSLLPIVPVALIAICLACFDRKKFNHKYCLKSAGYKNLPTCETQAFVEHGIPDNY